MGARCGLKLFKLTVASGPHCGESVVGATVGAIAALIRIIFALGAARTRRPPRLRAWLVGLKAARRAVCTLLRVESILILQDKHTPKQSEGVKNQSFVEIIALWKHMGIIWARWGPRKMTAAEDLCTTKIRKIPAPDMRKEDSPSVSWVDKCVTHKVHLQSD